jgi:hypothetical protein
MNHTITTTADKNFLKTKAVDIARNKIRNDNIAF